MPQFTNQAVHFSMLLKMPRSVRVFVRVYHIIQTQEGLRMCKNALHKLLHTQTRYQPPASQSISFQTEVQYGSKLLLKSKTLKKEKAAVF